MILMIYKSDVFKEFILPNADNENYKITLDKDLFQLQEDIVLRLDVTNKKWNLYSTGDYTFTSGKEYSDYMELSDGDIIDFHTLNNECFQGIVMEAKRTFHIFKKYDVTSLSHISIGKDQSNLIAYRCRDLISKNHGSLERRSDGFYIEDYSANGIFVNSKRIYGKARLNFGDVINIFGLTIVYLENILAVGSHYGNLIINGECLKQYRYPERTGEDKQISKKSEENVYFNRSPRNIPEVIHEKVEIEEPPAPKRTKKRPLIYVIGPSFTMAIPMILGCLLVIYSMQSSGRTSGAYMYTGLITAVGSAVIGGVWALMNLRYEKKSEIEEEQERFNAYGNYLIGIAQDLKAKYEFNTNAMNTIYKSAKECCSYDALNTNLWNRNYHHKDFLFERLGVGNVPFQIEIDIPKEKFSVVYDNLKEKPQIIKEDFKELKNVPVGIKLDENPFVGIVGGAKKRGAIQIVYQLIAQIGANNCYTDVKMVFAYREKVKKDWEFCKWLPHVWSEDKNTRYIAENKLEAGDIFYELVNILRRREEKENRETMQNLPYYVVFIEDESILEDEPFAKYVYANRGGLGMTVFLLSDMVHNLPNACETIIQNDKNFHGMYNTLDGNMKKQEIEFDSIGYANVEYLTGNLANIQVKEMGNNNDIPNQLSFLQMYGTDSVKELHVIDKWRKNRTYNTMKAPIGQKAGGNLCYLDIHEKYHGPHGLVAGTTGSGKSETLQTYILSLAINYSPSDVAFFLIDFKGGGMANLFSNLPHLVGEISNLSGNQVRRAMISIKSENKRRQRLFNQHGVNNINNYTRLFKSGEASVAIPHLLIIIDEFAELKREEPDFMRELISVAQVGRSLGVHLILATQKPSGTVDDNIWSNSKFRLCLRVQDRQDSNDMLHKPDAAYITHAGRCYLQVGNDEIFELFQSAWSGAIYDENNAENSANIAIMITNTGKTAIVGSRAKILRKEAEKRKWLCDIANIIKELTQKEEKTISTMEYQEKGMLIQKIFAIMEAKKMGYAYNKSNETKLRAFVELLPEDLTDVEKSVTQVFINASKQGVLLPEKKEATQLEAVVNYLNRLAEDNGYQKCMQLWLPVLEKTIILKAIDGYRNFEENKWKLENEQWNLDAVIGIYDDPKNQAQLPAVVDFANNGNYAVCGSVVSGKSTFIQTLVYALINKYSPKRLNIYALDFSSHMLQAFENAPHVGGIIYENDYEKMDKFFDMIMKIIEERKRLFNGGNYSQYARANGIQVPAVLIIIDNIANFREKTEDKYDGIITRISREGVGYGIFLLISAAGFGVAEIPGRVADNIKNVIALNMGDKFKYMEVLRTTSIDILPEEGVKGRGLMNVGGEILEFHTALAEEAAEDYERAVKINQSIVRMNAYDNGNRARKIPEIPVEPMLADLEEKQEYKEAIKSAKELPYAYKLQDASVYSIDLADTYCYVITGKAKTGKTNTLKLIMEGAHSKNAEIVVIEKDSSELKKIAKRIGSQYISTDAEMFQYWSEMVSVFSERNKYKRQLLEEEYSEKEIFDKMQKFTRIFIFINDIAKFVQSVYKPEEGVGQMSGFLENIIEKGALHNIYFVGCMNPDTASAMAGYKIYEKFIGYKKGVHLGGNISGQRIFNFSNIPFAELSKTYKRGIGLTPDIDDESMAVKIVIPATGRKE